MNEYLKWNETTIASFSEENINSLYNEGYVFGRPNKGYMNQTRSMRIDLSKFEMSSENRRVLRKTEDLQLEVNSVPYEKYSWEIGKLAKDFYTEKFGDGTFSANKIKEILTTKHNFNKLFVYSVADQDTGYAICFEDDDIFHYSYPFYNLEAKKNTGMGMMLRAIEYAKEHNKKYIYLGSAQRPSDTYKLQFKGLEWFDGEKWDSDLEELKKILHDSK